MKDNCSYADLLSLKQHSNVPLRHKFSVPFFKVSKYGTIYFNQTQTFRFIIKSTCMPMMPCHIFDFLVMFDSVHLVSDDGKFRGGRRRPRD